jgi:hypothetical protein
VTGTDLPSAVPRTPVTTWVENPSGGRERGLRGLARAWIEVLVRPRRFFRNGVAPGDQAPALVFAVAVAAAYASLLILFGGGRAPGWASDSLLRAVVAVALVGVLVAPAVLHLLAALQTLALMAVASDRAGVSETVQVIAYAAAPAPLAAAPLPWLRVVCTAYGTALLVVGLAEIHDTTAVRAAVAGVVPAALLFGYGFGGFDALFALLRAWYII